MLLAIDTATQFASIALYDEHAVWAERSWFSEHNHTVELMPAIADMFAQAARTPAHLRGVAVAIGPGSFTGMRIGLSVAKGLCLALDIPIKGVPTLDVLARRFEGSQLPLCAVVHAGRGRFCAGLYAQGEDGWGRQGPFHLLGPEGLPNLAQGRTIFCGELDDEARQALSAALGEKAVLASPAQAVRRAAVLAEIAWPAIAAGEGDDLAALSPIYLHTLGVG